MKKNVNYEINYATNTVTFATKFYNEATTDYGSDAAIMLRTFRNDGFTVRCNTHKTPIKRNDPSKVKTLTYKQMRDFLNILEDHEDMVAKFDSLVAAHKHDGDRLKVINKWFRDECPQYGKSTMYEFTDDGAHLVHNPNPVEEDDKIKSIA